MKTVSATEAKNNLGALLRAVKEDGESIVVENRREPVAVLISVTAWEEFLALQQEARNRRAMESLRRIAVMTGDRNSDLSEEQAMDLAVESIREYRRERASERSAAAIVVA